MKKRYGLAVLAIVASLAVAPTASADPLVDPSVYLTLTQLVEDVTDQNLFAGNSFNAKIGHAVDQIVAGDLKGACTSLRAARHQAQSMKVEGELEETVADALIAEIRVVEAAIGCPPEPDLEV